MKLYFCQIDRPGWKKDIFEETVKMSTYLVAFVISDFIAINGTTNKGTFIEIAARPEAIINKEGDYALEETKKIIDFFSDYFNVAYPLEKMSKLFFFRIIN